MRHASTGHQRVDGEMFTQAIAEHHHELARFAFRLCGDSSVVEDVLAEAYSRVWPRWQRGGIESPVAYLMRAVAHEVYKGHHRRQRDRQKESPAVRDVAQPFEEQVDVRDALWAALGRLPTKQRVVVVLRIVEDMPGEQVANMLGVPVGTVKSRLSRALVELRSMLEDHDG